MAFNRAPKVLDLLSAVFVVCEYIELFMLREVNRLQGDVRIVRKI
jgi:hypothetical protein